MKFKGEVHKIFSIGYTICGLSRNKRNVTSKIRETTCGNCRRIHYSNHKCYACEKGIGHAFLQLFDDVRANKKSKLNLCQRHKEQMIKVLQSCD